MGWPKLSWLVVLCWVLSFPCFRALGDDAEASVNFLKAPHAFSHLNIATFEFQVLVGGHVNSCTNCSVSCKVSSSLKLHLLLLLLYFILGASCFSFLINSFRCFFILLFFFSSYS